MSHVQDLASIAEDERILEMRIAGMTPSQIAAQMPGKWDHRRVSHILNRLASEAVARRNATVDEQHTLSLLRLEQLHRWNTVVLQGMLVEQDGKLTFTGKHGDWAGCLSVNVKIMERISKMLGLDKVPASDNWLNSRTPKEMEEYAAQLGIDTSMIPKETA